LWGATRCGGRDLARSLRIGARPDRFAPRSERAGRLPAALRKAGENQAGGRPVPEAFPAAQMADAEPRAGQHARTARRAPGQTGLWQGGAPWGPRGGARRRVIPGAGRLNGAGVPPKEAVDADSGPRRRVTGPAHDAGGGIATPRRDFGRPPPGEAAASAPPSKPRRAWIARGVPTAGGLGPKAPQGLEAPSFETLGRPRRKAGESRRSRRSGRRGSPALPAPMVSMAGTGPPDGGPDRGSRPRPEIVGLVIGPVEALACPAWSVPARTVPVRSVPAGAVSAGSVPAGAVPSLGRTDEIPGCGQPKLLSVKRDCSMIPGRTKRPLRTCGRWRPSRSPRPSGRNARLGRFWRARSSA
jgi:hypothetical protein